MLTEAESTPEGEGEGNPTPEVKTLTFTQEELDKLLQDNAAKIVTKYADYDELKLKLVGFDELKTKAEQLGTTAESLTKVTGERDTFAAENLRLRVALDKRLPGELIDRLKGATKEELEADADKLMSYLHPSGGGFDGGARSDKGTKPFDMNALIRARAGRGGA